jgi:hypothetical protein
MRALALLTVLAATIAAAQEPPAAAEPVPEAPQPAPAPEATPAPAPPSATALTPCPAQTTVLPQPNSACEEAPRPKLWLRIARIALEAVLGTGLGLLGELAGGYIGTNIDTLAGHESAAGVSIGIAFGAILTVAPGVWLGGSAMAGDGSFGWTMLGGAVGTALGAILIGIKNNTATVVIGAGLPVVGSILGYELSSNLKRAPAVTPVVGPNSVGLAGVW